MPVIKDQILVLEWTPATKRVFVPLGFVFTSYGEKFCVSAEMLPRGSMIELEFKCDFCGEVRRKKRSLIRDFNSVCCNDKCRKMSDRKRTSLTCAMCSKSFERNDTQIKANKSGIYYCSHKCSIAARIGVKDESKYTTNNCEQCGTEYEYQISTYKRYGTRFCSIPCRNKWESENKRGEKHHLFKAELIPCTYCDNKNFVCQSKIKQQENHFCNTECRQKWYAEVWSQSEEWKQESRERAVRMLSEGLIGLNSAAQGTVNSILDDLGIKYENEYNCKYYAIDNYLNESGLMIEVMGTYWHCDPRFYNLIEYQNQVDRIKNDKAKNTYIKNHFDVNILYLWECDISNSPDVCKRLIELYILNNGVLDNYHSFNYSLDPNSDDIGITNNILPYFHFKKYEIEHLIRMKDPSTARSMKQMDKWITFNCDNCGEEREELISHYKKNATHFCSIKCSHEYRRGKKLNKEIGTYQ